MFDINISVMLPSNLEHIKELLKFLDYTIFDVDDYTIKIRANTIQSIADIALAVGRFGGNSYVKVKVKEVL